jgi:hypothetical protein
MVWRRVADRLFAPPSHRREDWLYGFGFGALWFVLSFVHTFAWPEILLPLVLFAHGITAILPRTWLFPAALLRLFGLLGSSTLVIWLALIGFGWLR